ncbi:MAG: hypothetical protein ACI95T_001253 [Flavobacteriales bacterium]|jgi:hypothetical protein
MEDKDLQKSEFERLREVLGKDEFKKQFGATYSKDETTGIFHLNKYFDVPIIEQINAIKEKESPKELHVHIPILLEDEDFFHYFDLSNCVFFEPVRIYRCKFEEIILIRNSIFKGEFNIGDNIFKKNVKFHESIFEEGIKMENTEFHGLADFYSVTFNAPQQFYKTDFLDITIFSNAIFEKPAQWLYNKVSSKTIISFENAIFKDGIDISRANFFCKVTFWGVSVNPLIPNDLTFFLEGDEKEEKIKEQIALKRIRESYRKIKQVFISESNIIDSLTFKSKEMEVYWREMKKRKNIESSILLKHESINFSYSEYFTLLLANVSNHFGRSWTRALGFILGINLVGYLIILICAFFAKDTSFCFTPKCLGNLCDGYVELLNVTNWKFDFYGLNSESSESSGLYAFVFFCRIFIGYGIFQMITAFRKFGKS